MRFVRFILLVFFALSPSLFRAQVYNVDANQDANTIVVTYLLTEKSDITLHVSTDGGITFSKALKSVSGDVGKNISSGKKQIIWDVLSEYDSFDFERVQFKVNATSKTKNTQKTAFESNVTGLEYTIPVGACYYMGKKRVGAYLGVDMGVGYNTKQKNTDYSVAFTAGPKIGLGSNLAWIVGIGGSCNFVDNESESSISDILTGGLPSYNQSKTMFNFVVESGFVLRASKLLLSVRCQYMLPHSVVVPLVGVGLAF